MSKFDKIIVENDKLISGNYFSPPSKSHSFRALLLALYSNESVIKNILRSSDVDNFVDIIKSLGFSVERNVDKLFIKKGRDVNIENYYNFKNSGTALRFMVTYLSNLKTYNQRVVLDGDNQLKNRKIKKLLLSLHSLGLDYGFNTEKEIPFYITKKITSGVTHISGKSSQFLSSLLLNLPFTGGKSVIYIDELNEKPYIDMTLFHLRRAGINIENYSYEKMIVNPARYLKKFEFNVPGDFSSATYVILASVLSGSKINIYGLDLNDTQGDKKILEFLESMGVAFSLKNGYLNLHGSVNRGGVFDMNDTPDMLPALVFFLVQYPYSYKFTNLEAIRYKETDRVKVLFDNLVNMGVRAGMTDAELFFDGTESLNNITVDAHNDHRIIMGASLLGMKNKSKVTIVNTGNMDSSYPDYFSDIEKLGFSVKCSS